MAIAFTAVGNSNTGNTGGATVARTGTTNGRIALAAIVRASGTITAVPSGWDLVDEQAFTGGILAVYRHQTSSGDPTSWSFTLSATMRWATIVFEFSGVDTTTPVDVSNKQANNSGSTSVQAPAVDPNYLEDMLVYFGGINQIATWTPDAAMTEPASHGERAAASAVSVGGAYQLLSSGASTGTRTATASISGTSAGMLIALKDASATPESGDATLTVSVGAATADGTSTSASWEFFA